jgi:hypothetical protein
MTYDPQLDRYDTAIRAVLRLYRSGHWKLLAELGLTRKQHAAAIDRGLLEVGFPRTERLLFQFLPYCPALVEAATELLARYWSLSARSREFTYRGAP